MRVQFTLAIILVLLGLSSAYTRFKYHNGDEILRQLQLLDDKTYIIYFFNDPGNSRDLRTTNDYFKDKLRSEVIEPEEGEPTEYIYAEVDATDKYGNGYLVDRLGIDRSQLLESPTIVVMKNGEGSVIRGPTAIKAVKDSLEALDTSE